MKISNRLKTQISKEISDNFFEMLCAVDQCDRSNEISHEAWRKIHSKIWEQKTKLESDVFDEIARYHNKR